MSSEWQDSLLIKLHALVMIFWPWQFPHKKQWHEKSKNLKWREMTWNEKLSEWAQRKIKMPQKAERIYASLLSDTEKGDP
jgi:hypothetical protein